MKFKVRMLGWSGLLIGVSLLAGPASASAVVTPGSAGGVQVFLESDSAGDTMTLQCVSGQARYIEGSVNLLPCNVVTDIFITGAGGNDAVNLQSINATDFPVLRRVLIDGGTGADVINGTQTADTITADGNDAVNAGAGNDEIEGGAQVTAGDGDDVMTGSQGPADGGAGDDRFERPAGLGPYVGAAGEDTLSIDLGTVGALDFRFDVDDAGFVITVPLQPPAQVTWSSMDRAEFSMLDGGAQTVDATRYTGDLEAHGRGGPDTLIGGSGEDFLFGGTGNDVLEGHAGFDYADAGAGNDQLRLRDSEIDRGLCADGTDAVVADASDALAGCESVDLPDTTPPDTTGLKGPKKVKQGKVATFRFSSSESGSAFRCKVDKGKLADCSSPFKLKTRKLDVGKHAVSVVAVDAAGNADPSPAKVKFKVKAKRKK